MKDLFLRNQRLYTSYLPIQMEHRSTQQKGGLHLWHDRRRGDTTVNSDQARQRAEKSFKKEERARDGRAAMTEYEAQAFATRKKTARLKELRLAKEAQARSVTAL